MNERSLVSIIIPTHNSERTIERCLESIGQQTYQNIEIIIVDKISNDKTLEIAREYNARIFTLRAQERTEQINFGVMNSHGSYIYRVDSDFVLDDDVVEQAVNMCENDGYDAIAIHNTSDPDISFWSKVRKLERDCYRNDEMNIAARFMTIEAFNKIGGFDENLVASEDYDLHNKLMREGFSIGRISAQEMHIGEPVGIIEIVRKHYYYGKTLNNFIRKNPDMALKQLNPIRLSFFRNYKDFIRQPALTAGFFVYQIARYSSAILGYMSSMNK